jgi:hypothetical protein
VADSYAGTLSRIPVLPYYLIMPRKPTGNPTGRPKKVTDPTNPESASTQVNSIAIHAPGSAEMIASIEAQMSPVSGKLTDAVSKALIARLTYHKDLQTTMAAGQAAARLDEVPALQATVAIMTGEALASKKTIDDLKEEIAQLKLRLPSADLWDAQVSRIAADAKAEREKTEKAARDKIKADAVAAEEKVKVDEIRTIKVQIADITATETAIANRPLMFPNLPVPPTTDYWKAQLKRRDDLNHRLAVLEGRRTPEQEAQRKQEVKAKALLDEHDESVRAASDPHAERDPSERSPSGGGNVWCDLDGRPIR